MNKSQINKVLSYLKRGDITTSVRKEKRKVLHYANKQRINDDNYYCMTNTYTAYALKENIGLPLFEDLTEEERNKLKINTYPGVSRFFYEFDGYQEIKIMDYQSLCKIIKDNPKLKVKDKKSYYIFHSKITIGENKDDIMIINLLFLKEAYEILGKNLKCYVRLGNLPLLLTNPEGSMCLICPILFTDDKSRKTILDKCKELRIYD